MSFLDLLKSPLPPYLVSPEGIDVDTALASIYALRLVEPQDDNSALSIHRCIQAEIQERLSKDSNLTEISQKAKVFYLERAQDQASAQLKLGISYFEGKGVHKDYKQAFMSFHKSAKLGHGDASIWLGRCYYDGIGVERDMDKADECFRKLKNWRVVLDWGDCNILVAILQNFTSLNIYVSFPFVFVCLVIQR